MTTPPVRKLVNRAPLRRGLFLNTSRTASFITIIFFCCSTALAFKPYEFGDAGHGGITDIALIYTTRTVGEEFLKFSPRAMKQIRDANINTDLNLAQFLTAENHFDDESFLAGTTRLMDKKEQIIKNIKDAKGELARKDLGTALHTLQDFYAHTNWVELGIPSPPPPVA